MAAPVYALPLDLLRIGGGTVLFVYFCHAWKQTRDFSAPDGLIDHRLCARLFPPTRWSLFQPGMPGWAPRAAFACACLASLAVVAGFHPRAAAAFLFVVAASTYRWNVLVAYLDDCLVHVLCLWLALLPVGTTLAAPDLFSGGPAPGTADGLAATVAGDAPRAFMANMALVYVVAGLYKFASPMWRGGSAMHAALKMPVARFPGFWTLRHRGLLRATTWAALVLEPLFALVFVLPAGSALKGFLAAGAVIFHGGIAATLKIPYANAAMLAALPLAFGPEIMQGGLGLPAPDAGTSSGGATAEGVAGFALVGALAVMFAWEAARNRMKLGRPWSGGRWANPVRSLLWRAGVFQSYRLFDWVDDRNYHVRYEVRRLDSGRAGADRPGGGPPDAGGTAQRTGSGRVGLHATGGVAVAHRRRPDDDPGDLFPRSMRHLLLQSYLIGNVWLQMNPEVLEQVRGSLLARHARRFARRHPDAGVVEAFAVVQRVTPDNLDLTRGERRFLMRFECRRGRAVMLDCKAKDPCAAS